MGRNVTLGAAMLGTAPAISAVVLGPGLLVLGHIAGLALLGIALWHGYAVSAWTALLIAISRVLHFVFAVIAPIQALDDFAWGLTAVGFAAVAIALARDNHQDRAVPP